MTATPRRGQVTGQGHVGDAISSLATAQASEAEVVKDWRELLFQSDSTELQSKRSHSQTTRTRANNAGRAASSQSGGWGVSGAAHPAQPWASTAAPGPGPPPARPSPGSPHSVGSKGGFFQAEIGPVDGQPLSGLSSGVQTKSAR